MRKRPLSVTVLACVYIAVGAIGLVYHLSDLTAQHTLQDGILWISLVRVLAIVAGLFMLRGSDWARWLALAWIAFHVVISAFHSLPQLAVHIVFCAVFAYVLLRPAAAQYFRPRLVP